MKIAKRISILLVLTICLSLLSSCKTDISDSSSSSAITDISDSSQNYFGNSIANLQCGGFAAEYKGVTYLSTAAGVYAKNGNTFKKVCDYPIAEMNISAQGKLYGFTVLDPDHYNSLCVISMNLDGSDMQTIYHIGDAFDCSFLMLYNDTLYLSYDEVFLKIDIKTEEATVLADDLTYGITGISVDAKNRQFFYTGVKEDDSYEDHRKEETAFYSLSFDGTNKQERNSRISEALDDYDFLFPITDGKIINMSIGYRDSDYDPAIEIQATDTITYETQNRWFSFNTAMLTGELTEDIPIWAENNEIYCIMGLESGNKEEALCKISLSDDNNEVKILAIDDLYGYWINKINGIIYLEKMDLLDSHKDLNIMTFDPETNSLVDLLIQ